MIYPDILQNPENVCPDDIISTLESVPVRYVDFGGSLRMSEIVVARSVAESVATFFRNAHGIGFPIHEVAHASEYGWDDEALMAANVSSGFNYRTIAGTDSLSNHARGLAFDINPMQNPYIRSVGSEKIVRPEGSTWKPMTPGTLHKTHKLVLLMKISGWTWGGDWSASEGGADYQHFEKPHQ